MPKSVEQIFYGLACVILALFFPSSAYTQNQNDFNPAKSFCERQTFVLEDMDEVDPWLNYLSGLRNGRSPVPEADCPSSTIRTILNITSSASIEMAEDSRFAFFQFYVARAMESELAERRIDTDGSFRYRNDIVLAGFIWLLCPGHGEKRKACAKNIISAFPVDYIRSSPVFCDFSGIETARVEWPPSRSSLPLVCADSLDTQSASPDVWLSRAAKSLGE